VFTLAIGVGSAGFLGCNYPGSKPPESGEVWDAIYLHGTHCGYSQTVRKPVEHKGKPAVSIEGHTIMRMVRFDQQIDQEFRFKSIETPSGTPLRCVVETKMGNTPMVVTGELGEKGQEFHLVTSIAGNEKKLTLPWKEGYGGYFAIEHSLKAQPMQEGERRELQMLMPIMNQIASTQLIAGKREPVKLLDGQTEELLPVVTIQTFADGNELITTCWTNDRGEQLKIRVEGTDQESFRTTEAIAKAGVKVDSFDWGSDAFVSLEKPLPNAHNTKQVRYLVKVEGGDPSRLFSRGATQGIRPIDANSAEIIVQALRPGEPLRAGELQEPPTDLDVAPSSLIQADDPEVVRLAHSVARDTEDPWQIATALEKLVHGHVEQKGFSVVLASAAEVAKNRSGDCTEHAVLLAALLRARGIPARVAMGFVYVSPREKHPHGAFGGHMWTEAYIGNRWIPLDSTLAQGGIGGGHLKISDSNLSDGDGMSSFLPILPLISRLKIEVLEAS